MHGQEAWKSLCYQVVKDGSCKSIRCQFNQHPANTMSSDGEASATELPDKKEISLATTKRKKRGQSKQKALNEDSDSGTEGGASATELPDKKEISLATTKRKKRGQSKQKAPNEDSDSVPERSSSSISSRKRTASIRGAANVATEDSEFDPVEERPKKDAKRRKTKKGGKSDHICPHCEKSFTSEGGVKYHVGESLLKAFNMIDLPVFLSYILILILF
jgi:hypothetical protein